jgi:Ca2+-transporting ATPase
MNATFMKELPSIAMGVRDTQVAKETADMVLNNDSFNSIVVAIMQGRVTIENIKKNLIYLLSNKLSETFIVFVMDYLTFLFLYFHYKYSSLI